ncbi:hypothetical protein EV182_006784, partial [Spiromyces aspiralis]
MNALQASQAASPLSIANQARSMTQSPTPRLSTPLNSSQIAAFGSQSHSTPMAQRTFSPPPNLQTASLQRKASLAGSISGQGELARQGTPTLSDSGAYVEPPRMYTAEEIQMAQRKSEEFIARVPTFTEETFQAFVKKHLKDRDSSQANSRFPTFNDTQISLLALFSEVIKLGGMDIVQTKRLWRNVARGMGLPDLNTVPPLLGRWYKVWLLSIEQELVFPPGHPKHQGVETILAKSRKKRKSEREASTPRATPAPQDAAISRAEVATPSRIVELVAPNKKFKTSPPLSSGPSMHSVPFSSGPMGTSAAVMAPVSLAMTAGPVA